MNIRVCFGLMGVIVVNGCSGQPSKPASVPSSQASSTAATDQTNEAAAKEWIGVYSSPEEIGGFTGTVLVLEKGIGGEDIWYRKRFYSDVINANEILQKVRSGTCLVDQDCLYIPVASGYREQGDIRMQASVEKYRRVTVNGYRTLMRDDAYRIFTTENKLYDYGILIQVPAKPDWKLELDKVEHLSIKVLYADQTKPWSDPYVKGPNER